MAWLALELVFVLAVARIATASLDVTSYTTAATLPGVCNSLEGVYADVHTQRPAACSLISASVEGPARSQAEHLFLRYSRLHVPQALTQPLLLVYVGAGDDEDAPEVNHRKQCLYLSGVLKHIVRKDLAMLLENDAERLQAQPSSLIARTHLPVVSRLRAESGRLVNSTMHVLSVLSNLSRTDVVEQAHHLSKETVKRMKSRRNGKPGIVQSHGILLAYCATLRSIEATLRDLIAVTCA